jgi:hypothetical protein
MQGNRTDPPQVADERATLTGFLDYQRATLAWKCEGVPPERLIEATVPPSKLSLLGLVRHMADVERSWFRERFADEALPLRYSVEGDWDGDFDNVSVEVVDDGFAAWREECEHARRIVAAAPSLDALGRRGNGSPVTLRWILLHMLEEYARHNGHADLLRERIDGAVGE